MTEFTHLDPNTIQYGEDVIYMAMVKPHFTKPAEPVEVALLGLNDEKTHYDAKFVKVSDGVVYYVKMLTPPIPVDAVYGLAFSQPVSYEERISRAKAKAGNERIRNSINNTFLTPPPLSRADENYYPKVYALSYIRENMNKLLDFVSVNGYNFDSSVNSNVILDSVKQLLKDDGIQTEVTLANAYMKQHGIIFSVVAREARVNELGYDPKIIYLD